MVPIPALFSILLLIYLVNKAECVRNISEYYELPPLYKLDDYDKCLKQYPDIKATYCMVKTRIHPDNNSVIWGYIEKYSENRKSFFRHDILDRGICLNTCMNTLSNIRISEQNVLYQKQFAEVDEFMLNILPHSNTLEFRRKYNKILNICVNLELKNEFNLSGYSEIEYCEESNDGSVQENDWLDTLFLATLSIIFALSVLSTYYDYLLRTSKSEDHFSMKLSNNTQMKITSFSIPRNWKRLTQIKIKEEHREFRYLDGMRFFCALFVIVHHVFMAILTRPISNLHILEELNVKRPAITVASVRLFFTLSAFLLSWQMMAANKAAKIKVNFRNYFRIVLYRYMRLAPTFSFTVLLTATFQSKVGDGPLWMKYSERNICRKNWWHNLLFIHNYASPGELCIPQSWYLAAEFQMFLVGLALLFLILKYSNRIKCILGLPLLASYAIVAAVIYHFKFNGTVLLPINTIRNFMLKDEDFIHNYLPTHMSIGPYFVGLICGYIYHNLKERQINLFKYALFRVIFYSSVASPIALMTYSKLFFDNEYEKPALWIAISGSFVRHLWAWTFCIMIVGCAQKEKSSFRIFLERPIFTVLGKLSYSILLSHVFVLKSFAGTVRTIGYYNWSQIVEVLIPNIVLTLILSLAVTMLVELPANALFQSFSTKVTTKDTKTN